MLRTPTCRKSIRPTPDGRYVVRFKLGRKDCKRLFSSYEAAAAYVRDQNELIQNFGKSANQLTGSQFSRILSLANDLAREVDPEKPRISEGVIQLEKAVSFYLKHRRMRGIKGSLRITAVTIDHAVQALIEQWQREKKDHG